MSTAAPSASPTTPPAEGRAAAPAARSQFHPRMLVAFVLPLYFVLLMAATLVTALHHPAPHDLALTVAGSSATTQQLAAGIQRSEPSGFDITQTLDSASARTAVLRREAVGAVVVSTGASPVVTTYIASAGGRSAATAVEAVGTGIAGQLQATSRVVDLAPLRAADSLGTGVFYLVVFSSIGGYLTLIVLTQVLPHARLRTKYLVAATTAVLTPVLVFGLASIFLGGFGASFSQIMAVLGVEALYVFTIGLIVIAAEQLLGRAAMFLIAPVAIFGNLASAGGASPESMLPGFWQALHSIWFGAGANEAMRSILYFPGANPVRWIIQVLIWTIALLVITLFVEGVRQIWRLQSVVLRTQRQSDTMREHLQLLSLPRQSPPQRAALTGAAAEPAYQADVEPDAQTSVDGSAVEDPARPAAPVA